MRILLAIGVLVGLPVFGQTTSIVTLGLQASVEVYRDGNGVNHIYAQNEHDLFFAQGYCAAKDRLFQFELWRRQATGTVAEILGSREIKRDVGARLFKFRGDITKELNHYHPQGKAIIQAFTDGINAHIAETEINPSLLPLEFSLLKIKPGRWTPEVVISRHQGLLSNLTEEITIARAVATLGEDKVKQLYSFEPGEPNISIHPSINKTLLFDNIIEPYEAFRKALSFTPDDLKVSAHTNWSQYQNLTALDAQAWQNFYEHDRSSIGSNNWVVSGKKSKSGYPLLANDPHRAITAPSLRYLVHLSAPGWNVVGGGEPTIPGVSIGHNAFGAWGLTIFQIDAEDLYVYELNPENPRQYRYQDRWETMRAIPDTIHVKGSADVYLEHLYTRHGPVTYVDSKSNVAFAVRCAWLDIGAAPYLASLRINQAQSVQDFFEACRYSHLPAENMIWADRSGNIAWQAVGVAPIRKNWSGLVPVPGNGAFEWDGYLPIRNLPHMLNPEKGFVATANENNVPDQYAYRNAVGWDWAEPYRSSRIHEVLSQSKSFSLNDMMALQFDYVALPARELVPLLQNIQSTNTLAEKARSILTNGWNYHLGVASKPAAIYVAWEKRLAANMLTVMVPEAGKKYVKSLPLNKVIDWLKNPPPEMGTLQDRNNLLIKSLEEAAEELKQRFGDNLDTWQYDHHVLIKHPLSNIVTEEVRKKIEAGPLPRGGYSHTPGMTTSSLNQLAGASFRMAVDTKNWDACMFTNAPGQSGNPDSPYYKNLFAGWATDKHFVVQFNKKKIVKESKEKTILLKQ